MLTGEYKKKSAKSAKSQRSFIHVTIILIQTYRYEIYKYCPNIKAQKGIVAIFDACESILW